MKEESEKTALKQHLKNEDHGIWSHHFMANGFVKMRNLLKHGFYDFQGFGFSWSELRPRNL